MKTIFEWSEVLDTSEHCAHYTHVWAKVGEDVITIEWKGWKDYDSFCVMVNGDYMKALNLWRIEDLLEAKILAEEMYAEKIVGGISKEVLWAYLRSKTNVKKITGFGDRLTYSFSIGEVEGRIELKRIENTTRVTTTTINEYGFFESGVRFRVEEDFDKMEPSRAIYHVTGIVSRIYGPKITKSVFDQMKLGSEEDV